MCVRNLRRFLSFLSVAAVCTGATAGSLHAQGRLESPTDIRVLHLQSKVVEPPFGSSDEKVLAAENGIRMRGDERLRIVLADRNPFLFTYQSKTEEKETAEQKLAAQFGAVLETVAAGFRRAGGAPPSGAAKRVIEGLDVEAVIAALTELNGRLTRDVKTEITRSVDSDPKEVARVKTIVASWNIAGLTTRLNDNFAGALAIIQKCATKGELLDGGGQKVSCEEPAFQSSRSSVLMFAMSINALAADTRTSLALLGEFVDDAMKLHEEVVLGDLSSSPFNRVVTVTATPVVKYKRFFEAQAKDKQTRR